MRAVASVCVIAGGLYGLGSLFVFLDGGDTITVNDVLAVTVLLGIGTALWKYRSQTKINGPYLIRPELLLEGVRNHVGNQLSERVEDVFPVAEDRSANSLVKPFIVVLSAMAFVLYVGTRSDIPAQGVLVLVLGALVMAGVAGHQPPLLGVVAVTPLSLVLLSLIHISEPTRPY